MGVRPGILNVLKRLKAVRIGFFKGHFLGIHKSSMGCTGFRVLLRFRIRVQESMWWGCDLDIVRVYIKVLEASI